MATPSKKRLGKHLLKSRLGQGGMGVVYLAFDERLKRIVAIKVLPKELSSNEQAVRRFLREARAAGRISHPNVVSIYDVDQDDGHTWLSMELMPGGSVQDLLKAGPLDWQRATRLIADACRGLAAAHAAGLIHRDVKPSNLMLAADDSVKVADFGLVKDVDGSRQTLTRDGTLMGTPQFMSPEQCRGEPLDVRSDLYSLGATWYALLTGQGPYAELDPLQAMFAHCSREFPDPRDRVPDIPSHVAAALKTATAGNRADRFGSAEEMLRAISELLQANTSNENTASNSGNTGLPLSSTLNEFSAFDAVPAVARMVTVPVASPTREKSVGRRKRHSILKGLNRKTAIVATIIAVVVLSVFAIWYGQIPQKSQNGTNRQHSFPVKELAASDGSAGRFPGEFTLELVWSLAPTGHFTRSVSFSANGSRVYTVDSDDSVREWNIPEQKAGHVMRSSMANDRLQAVVVSPDGSLLAAGGSGRYISLWRLNDGTPLQGLNVDSPVNSLAFRPDGSRLAIGCEGELSVATVGPAGLTQRTVLSKSQSRPIGAYMTLCVEYSSDGRWLASTAWEQRSVSIWDAEANSLQTFRSDLPAQPRSVCFISGSESGAGAVVLGLSEGGRPGGLYRWNFRSAEDPGKLIELRDRPETGVWLAATRDGRSVISVGGWNEPAILVDSELSHYRVLERARLSSHTRCVSISRDGQLVAISGGDSDHGPGQTMILRVVPAAKNE